MLRAAVKLVLLDDVDDREDITDEMLKAIQKLHVEQRGQTVEWPNVS